MNDLVQQLQQPEVLYLIGIFIFLAILNAGQGQNTSKLRTRAVEANNDVKYRLSQTAIEQLKKREIDKICLYSGSFKNWQIHPFFLACKIFLTGYPPSLFVPSANRSIEVVGAPGSGKTFSVIDRLLVSAIEQNFPILLYDYKGGPFAEGGQIPYVGTFAARHRYKMRIFAPGREYSCIINPLDFINDETDMTMAETIAEIFHENLRGNTGKTDGFFGPAGKRVLFTTFLLAKNTKYPDLAMVFELLKLPSFVERLVYAATQNRKYFSDWVQVGYGQIMSVVEAEDTKGGILAGAQDIATIFMQKDLLPCLIGKTNISLDLNEKEIIIFQSQLDRQRVINPLIAAVMEILINKNFSYQRTVPLVASLDEYRTLKNKKSIHWPNEHRSKGFVGIYAYQSKPQLEEAYEKSGADILRTGLNIRFWFNPQNLATAREFSEFLGKKEVLIQSKSTSRTYSPSGSQKTVSISEQLQLTPIMNPDDFTALRKGSCVYLNSDSENRERAYIPWIVPQVIVSKRDMKLENNCKRMWSKKIIPQLIQREQAKRKIMNLDDEVKKRRLLAETLFPLPPKNNQQSSVNLNKSAESYAAVCD